MNKDNRKVAIVGAGFVGTTTAYTLLNQGICDEIVLIDKNEKKALGEAMDINHSIAFAPNEMRIKAGSFDDCADADIVLLSAGISQKPDESRISLLSRNCEVFAQIIEPIIRSGFYGIFVVATNPVDIMTRFTREISGFDSSKILGTGTTLDTARLRFLLGRYFRINAKNVHAYVIGEHGDSELIPWSQAMIATKNVFSICSEHNDFNEIDLKKIGDEVKFAAKKIIEAKNATYYGIGMANAKIIKAIFNDENSVITTSSLLSSEKLSEKIYIGVPSIINRTGVKSTIKLNLTEEENGLFLNSCKFVNEVYSSLNI